MALSNFDRRRVNGPEESFSPVFAPEQDPKLFKSGEPRNKRGPLDIRPICASLRQSKLKYSPG